jgi:hypothetical protein
MRGDSSWAGFEMRLAQAVEEGHWSTEEHRVVSDFVVAVKAALRLDEGNLGRIVRLYLQLVRDLAELQLKAAAGSTGTPDPPEVTAARQAAVQAMVLGESGRLIDWLDPHAYDGVPFSEVIDPIEFITRHERNDRIRRRLRSWVQGIPKKLVAVEAQLLHTRIVHTKAVQTRSAKVANFPFELLQCVQALGDKPVPRSVGAVVDLIKRGKTSLSFVEEPALVAFYWPVVEPEFGELLISKEALQLLKHHGVHIAVRTLFERAKKRPTLKRGSKYVRDELLRAVTDGLFE